MTITRYYLVHDERAKPDTESRRLVRASTPAAAIRHVVSGQFRAVVADQDALIAAMDAGVKPETAA
jgi:hypothetical protein